MTETNSGNGTPGWLIVVLIFFCFPISLILLWASPPKKGFLSSDKERWVFTGVVAAIFILFIALGSGGPDFSVSANVSEGLTTEEKVEFDVSVRGEGAELVVNGKPVPIEGGKHSFTSPLKMGDNYFSFEYKSGEKSEKKEYKFKRTTEEKIEAEKKERIASIYKEFEKEFLSLETRGNALSKQLAGRGNVVQKITIIRQARDAYKECQLGYSRIEIPSELPDDIKELLKSAKSDASTNCYVKRSAYETFLEGIAENNPVKLSEAQTELQGAQSFALKVGVNLASVRAKLDLIK